MRNRPEMTAILKWRWLLFVPFCAVWGLAFESLAGVAGKAVLSLSAGLICGQFMRRRPYSKRKRFCLGPASVAGLFVCWNYSLGFAVKLAALRCNECLSGMAVLWLAGCISLAAIPLLFLLQSRRVLLPEPDGLPALLYRQLRWRTELAEAADHTRFGASGQWSWTSFEE